MQKFEDECRMEFENVEPMILGCQKMKRISKAGKKENRRAYCRCLHAMFGCNGYINFRMRAMVVSFTFNLFGKIGVSCIF
jgi:hypothetical protein